MIRINQLKLPVTHGKQDLRKKAAKLLRVKENEIRSLSVAKQSVDARKKDSLLYIYSVDVELEGSDGVRGDRKDCGTVAEKADRAAAGKDGGAASGDEGTPAERAAVKRAANPNVQIKKERPYRFPSSGTEKLGERPVIVGCGPAGLFCGLMLARAGYRPILVERGEPVEERRKTVETFWAGGALKADSNVQFGEGGAGTFSDGKLNTLVKDPSGRNQEVLRILVEAGADPSILYVSKPHIGTDVLSTVVRNIREEICRLGGEVRFNTRVSELILEHNAVSGLRLEDSAVCDGSPKDSTRSPGFTGRSAVEGGSPEGSATGGDRQERPYSGRILPARAVVLAVGHSARDTFEMLYEKQVRMEAKSFAVGLRIQHPQKLINLSQYGMEDPGKLGAAGYKLTAQTGAGRGVYSFCMCPGGYVVDASSEPGRLAVNGMSNHSRDGLNANSALIVTVTPEDFPDASPLGGMQFQRELEEEAFRCGGGRIPVQLYGDFRDKRMSTGFLGVEPEFKGGYSFGDLRTVLPAPLCEALIEGMGTFGRRIVGFDRPDAILAGVESRTSSPIRIPRDDRCESAVRGLYPCGEGAGYAGGITSAAMDGIRVAEAIAERFAAKG